MTIQLIEHENPGVIAGLLFSVLPWVPGHALDPPARDANRERRTGSCAAHAQSAALGERQPRLPRELPRRARTLASAPGAAARGDAAAGPQTRALDPRSSKGLERAHHLAMSGLTEARQAISALRGDDLPALEDLAGIASDARRSPISGTPRDAVLGGAARRSTARPRRRSPNVRRHSASDRVELASSVVSEDWHHARPCRTTARPPRR